jgi:hypothetical protein
MPNIGLLVSPDVGSWPRAFTSIAVRRRHDRHRIRQDYMLSSEDFLMPTRKDQTPPDLRYFKQSKK